MEPHAHLDKAFLAERVTNRTGDLLGAVEAMMAARGELGVEDTVERAERAARLLAANGFAAVRSHADTTTDHGLRSIEALAEVRRRVADSIDVQVVALCGWPIAGAGSEDQRALLVDALAAGADLVGGAPHFDTGGSRAATETLLQIAADHGVGVDLHTDETLELEFDGLSELAELVTRSGFEHPVTASHCVSLGMRPPDRQREVAELVAAAGISVVALPATNLYLQGRQHQEAMPRGVTAVHALRAAGAVVAAGGDNLQDPFNPVGRGCPFETAALDDPDRSPAPGGSVGDGQHRRPPCHRSGTRRARGWRVSGPAGGQGVHDPRGDRLRPGRPCRHPPRSRGWFANVSRVCRSTSAPAVTSSGCVCSPMLWDNPPTLGVKIIAAGQIRASIWASCPAPLGIRRVV